ncbi:MAG: hypothetical protein KC422_02245 [Trueperaceae bacterium]|nr:hypothetical protein [Trueperaceae bacterium]
MALTPEGLVRELTSCGVTLRVEGEHLVVTNKNKLTRDLIDALKSHKLELIHLLNPQRSHDASVPDHWRHIPVMPVKGERVARFGPNGEGLRYRICLFDVWYIIRFEENADVLRVTNLENGVPKNRMFTTLDEFHRWAWAETFFRDLTFLN